MPFAGWRRFFRDQSGSVAIMSASFGICLIAATAISVDVAVAYLERRRCQGALDLAAIAAAQDLAHAELLARKSLAQNGVPAPLDLMVTLGRYEGDVRTPPPDRFKPNHPQPNAVRLTMSGASPLFFARGLGNRRPISLSVGSAAAATRMASVRIGSRLASLDGGVENVVLSAMLGASLSLTALDYNALSALQVDMPDLLAALAAGSGRPGATYEQVLSTSIQARDLAGALSAASRATGAAAAALNAIHRSAAAKAIDLAQLISMGPFAKLPAGSATGVSTSASALDILSAAAGVANAGTTLTVDLGAQIPGVLAVSASIDIGERAQDSPWMAVGVEGTTVSTAQTRLRLNARVAGPPGLPTISLPIAVDVASGSAQIRAAACGANPKVTSQVSLAVKPGVASAWIGTPLSLESWRDFSQEPSVGPATLMDALIASVTGEAYVAITNLGPTMLSFSGPEIEQRAVKSARTADFIESPITTLISNLELTVKLLGLGGVGAGKTVATAVLATLSPLGAPLDALIDSVLNLSGVGLGEADVSVRSLRCDGAALIE